MDVNTKTPEGKTAKNLASERAYQDVVEILEKKEKI